MWAQIIKTRVKPGKEGEVAGLLEALRAVEQPDSGLLRTTAMWDQHDPSQLYLMVVFESEEAANAARQMAENGPMPEFAKMDRVDVVEVVASL